MSAPPPGAAPRVTTMQRRLVTVSAGLGVAVLTGLAFAVTYGDLKALALAGHASKRLAPAYPIMFDALIVVAILALLLARHARWWSRWSRWLLLLALLAGAGAGGVERAIQGYGKLPQDSVKAGVAAAPHLMLLIAVWLWLGMFRHARSSLGGKSGTVPGTSPAVPGAAAVPSASGRQPLQEFPEPAEHPEDGWRHFYANAQEGSAPPHEPATDPYVGLVPGFAGSYEPRNPLPVPRPESDYVRAEIEPGFVEIGPAFADAEPAFAEAEPAFAESEPAFLEVVEPPFASTTLPTDVKLVSKPTATPPAATTRPDLVVIPADTGFAPDEFFAEEEDDIDVQATDRAEDSDAGGDSASTHDDIVRWDAEETEDAQKWAAESATYLGTAGVGTADTETAEANAADLGIADLGRADVDFADLATADLATADLPAADVDTGDVETADLEHEDGSVTPDDNPPLSAPSGDPSGAEPAADVEWTPPSSKFRSSPTPPSD